MEAYEILKDLAIIMLAAEIFGLLARWLKGPQVVGQIIAGLLIGPCILGLINPNSESGNFIEQMAEIGVIMIMFSAGLETIFYMEWLWRFWFHAFYPEPVYRRNFNSYLCQHYCSSSS